MDGYVKVKFLRGASCAPYFLAYNAGHVGYVKPDVAAKLESEGFAVYLKEQPKAKATASKDGTTTRRRRSTRKHK